MVLTVQVSKHPSTFLSLMPLPNLHLITATTMFVMKSQEESSEHIVHLMKNFVNSLLRQA